MEETKQKKLQNFNFTEEEQERLQKIAFHQVFEPFEINGALKLVRGTRLKIEENVVDPVSQKIHSFKNVFLQLKEKAIFRLKKKNQITSENFNFSKVSFFGLDKDSLNKFYQEKIATEKQVKNFQKFKENYYQLEEKLKFHFFDQLDKALSSVFERKWEKVVLKKSNKILGIRLKTITEIQRLGKEERKLLLDYLYPFELNTTGKIRKSLNQSSNILLGLVVASNIPFTGVTVNMLTTIKTVVYLSNRLQLLSAIYGYPVICKEAIFSVSTKILTSIVDYESNPQHQPLHPSEIAGLYQFTIKSSLPELLKKATIKDLYISVPLVGSLSLAKITLDEQSITQLTLQLVCDYFALKELEKKWGKKKIDSELECWKTIYWTQKKSQWLQKLYSSYSFKKVEKKKFQALWKRVKSFKKKEQEILETILLQAKQIRFAWEKEKGKCSLKEFTAQWLKK